MASNGTQGNQQLGGQAQPPKKGGGMSAVDELAIEGKSSRRKLIERASIAGLGISVLVHLVLLAIALIVRIDYKFADAGGDGGGPVEFAILMESELQEPTAIDVEEVNFEEIVSESIDDLNLLSETGSERSVFDLADTIAPELEQGGASITDIDIQTGASGAGTGDGASFFGLEASGKRFAYIVDRSGSMDFYMPSGEKTRWEATQIQLIQSIHGLSARAEYFVVLYSSDASPLFGGSGWVKGSQGNKASTSVAVMGQFPNGGTKPESAFEMVFALNPKPDAIYFMTDGEFKDRVPAQIAQLNRKARVPIHCIFIGDDQNLQNFSKVESMLKTIARSSNGRYRHIKDVQGGRSP